MSSPPLRTQALVLSRTNYGEADRILQVITPEGRCSIIAKAARKQKSRLAGGIELFAVSDVVIQSGKGQLDILTSARLVQFYGKILEDYDRLKFGYEVLKQIRRGSETVDSSEWFELARQSLAGLDNSNLPIELIETWFYLHYAELIGYGLSLYVDIDGRALEAENRYLYDDNERGLRRHERGNLTASHIKLMRLMATKPLNILMQISGVESVVFECLSTARRHAALE